MNIKEAREIVKRWRNMKDLKDDEPQVEYASGIIDGWNQAHEKAEVLARALEKIKLAKHDPRVDPVMLDFQLTACILEAKSALSQWKGEGEK